MGADQSSQQPTYAAEKQQPATNTKGIAVKLNVYSPSQAVQQKAAQQQQQQRTQTAGTNTMSQVPQVPGFGVYHSGVVINGREYTFGGGGGSGSGVVEHTPGAAYGRKDGNWQFYKTVDLGCTKLNSKQISGALSNLRGLFPSNSYDLMGKNCNHFCEMANSFRGGTDFVDKHKAVIMEEERKRKAKEAKLKELKNRQTKLKAEPPSGSKGVVVVQVNCPSGSKVRRRFLETDTIGDVMEFVYASDAEVKRRRRRRRKGEYEAAAR
eukprot:jgi/Bigna1/84997/estExt_fgenesh1_pg.C_10562